MDRRDNRRHEVQLPVSFSGDEILGKGSVFNIGVGGCAVKGDKNIRVGAFVELRIDLPHLDAPLPIDVAVVRWAIGQKFGLDFLEIRPEEQKRLRRFIKTL